MRPGKIPHLSLLITDGSREGLFAHTCGNLFRCDVTSHYQGALNILLSTSTAICGTIGNKGYIW